MSDEDAEMAAEIAQLRQINDKLERVIMRLISQQQDEDDLVPTQWPLAPTLH